MRELLTLMQRPSRYLGSEWGSVRKDPAQVSVRLALAFPDLYEVGMSYLGQRLLYALVNRRPQWWAERVYCPDSETLELLRGHGAPLATLESDTPLTAMDAVAFHVTHELCYDNILAMLDAAGLPLWARERDESHPLVMAGGGCTFNAEPLAPFMDVMVLGDGEAALPPILEVLAAHKGLPRRELLLRLKDIPGVYVPAFFESQGPFKGVTPLVPGHDTVHKAVVASLEPLPAEGELLVGFGQAVHDRLTLEIARGCTRGCRFCHAGVIYRPVRERSLQAVAQALDRGLGSGLEEISLLSLSTGDYSALEGLFEQSFARCSQEQVSISLPSLRVGSVSGRLYKLMAKIRRTGVTLAPEAGSQRLRDVINKGITEEQLLDHIRRLFANGWRQVKLYFMIGLPTETDEDLEEIFQLCRRVDWAALEATQGDKRLQITAAVSPFVPKAHTPFQWQAQIGLQEIRRRVELLRARFKTVKRLKLRWHEPEMSYLEGILSRGGRELAPVLAAAHRRGAMFSSWVDQLDLGPWLGSMLEAGLNPDDYLAARDPDGALPWDHLSSGVSKDFLRTELRRALEATTTPDCRYDACRACGVCNHEGRGSPLRPTDGQELRPLLVRPTRDQREEDEELATPEEAAALAEAPAPQPAPPAGQGRKPKAPAIDPELTQRNGHYRVWFSKTGPAAWLSALEVQSVWERSLRRAGIGPSFTQGFHPLPMVSFGRALSVGVASRAEWLTLFTRRPYASDELRERLAASLPVGFGIESVEELDLARRQPQPQVEEFEALYDGPDVAGWETAWQAFAAAQSVVALKGDKPVELRAPVRQVLVQGRMVRLLCDWSDGYVNPLFLARQVAAGVENVAMDLRLTKTAQRFGDAPAGEQSQNGA